ncbi:MAG: radical SAM protein [Phycisphaerae bacterium]|nr:radical SAM protein [Phycisphaerae bacterium]
MELPRRDRDDIYLPDGLFRQTLERLRERKDAHNLRIGIVNAFDFRTRMLPYWYADKRMAPCSVRTLADTLHAAGFRHLRVVLQQWTPHFRPSAAILNGRPLDILLVSAMQVHAEPSYNHIRDAHRLGDARPWIVAGGPKAIYEPTDYFELGPQPGIGADCVVTGEAFVLLDLLESVLREWDPAESPRAAYDRARTSGSLQHIPGLVYLSPNSRPGRPVAISTGVQRLLRDLDELPMPDAGYRLLEPPHRGTGLRPHPLPPETVGKHSMIASLIVTQGCRFACPYCPIPAVNQRTWRHKSGVRMAAEMKHVFENFGIRQFFGTDDNFFNNRETVLELMEAVASTESNGKPLSAQIRFYTEATQFDVSKNQDILPACRKGGLRGIWFGIEDLTAELVKKGQNAQKTKEAFRALCDLGIQPHVMMIHSDDQPLRSPRGTLAGLLNQARFVRDAGAVSYQCTYIGPALGSRNLEPAFQDGTMFRTVGGKPLPQAFFDGNHVTASKHPRPWSKQLNLLWTYLAFYNPWNMVRAFFGLFRKSSIPGKRFMFQIIGQVGLVLTIPRMFAWAWRLKRGPIVKATGLEPARIPLIDVHTREQIQWAIENVPDPDLSQETLCCARPSGPQPSTAVRAAS